MIASSVRPSSYLVMLLATACLAAAKVHDLGGRRELFVDRHQIESMSGSARSSLAGKTVRLRFVLCDADVNSYRFTDE